MTDIKKNIANVKGLIESYAKKYGREKEKILLLLASKGQSIEKIKEAIHAKEYHFGESYLQEALFKIEALQAEKEIVWHFIGPIQRNKTRKIATHFNWAHSVDDIDIAKRLSAQRPPDLPPLNICIQVNISKEHTKSGISLEDVEDFALTLRTLPHLLLRGLMCIPAKSETIDEARVAFHQLFLLRKALNDKGITLDTLSMGMSFDFEAAIAEGSTIVRIGTKIFGKRE